MPPGVVTRTLAVPALPLGVLQVIVESLLTETLVAALPPMVTPVVPVKYCPEMVTEVRPAAGPVDGEILETVGMLSYW